MIKKLFFALTLISVLSGCAFTYTYKTKDVKKSLKKLDRQLNKFDKTIVNDYNSKAEAYKTLITSGADASKAPYPDLESRLNEMKQAKLAYQDQKKKFSAEKNQLMKMLKGKKKIKSNEPAFSKVDQFRKTAEQHNKVFEKHSKFYTSASNRFVKTMNANQIYKVEVKKMKGQVDKERSKIKKLIGKFEKAHQKNKKRLGSDNKRMSELSKVDAILGNVKVLNKKAGKTSTEFVTEVGKQKIAYVAPHMASHKVLAKLKEIYNQMNSEFKRANKVYKKAQNMK